MPLNLPKGFEFSGLHCGLKDSNEELDLSLAHSIVPAQTCGVFTQNHFPGEPIKLAKERLKDGLLQTLIVNSRYSNVATGQGGQDQARSICSVASAQLGIDENLSLISSTGIIGRPYPESVIETALPELISQKRGSEEQLWDFAKGIMTTDTIPKAFSTTIDKITLTAVVKGSGMIAPNMATMLAFIFCDADLQSAQMAPILKRVVDRSFNNISIDFDTSTSDSCIWMCNGAAGSIAPDRLETKLDELCQTASKALVLDGEGVTHLIDCRVHGATDSAMARKVADSVVNSPLVKTMITGADPNWGRLIMAIGKTPDPRLKGSAPTITIAGEQVFKHGSPLPHDLETISKKMKSETEVTLDIDLHLGDEEVTFFGANLTHDYVSINADYTT